MAGTTTVKNWVPAAQHRNKRSRLMYCDIDFTADASDGGFVAGDAPAFTGLLQGFDVILGGTAPTNTGDLAIARKSGATLIAAAGQGLNALAGGYFPAVVANSGGGTPAYETGLIPVDGQLTVTPTNNAVNSATMTVRLWGIPF
jgi:hypothetical protein